MAGDASASDRAALAGELAVLTAFRCLVDGDAPGALAAAERALALLPEAASHARGGAIGMAAPAALAVDGADAVLRRLEALSAAPTGSADAAPAWALPGVGIALVLAGRHHEAAGAGRALLELGRDAGAGERPVLGPRPPRRGAVRVGPPGGGGAAPGGGAGAARPRPVDAAARAARSASRWRCRRRAAPARRTACSTNSPTRSCGRPTPGSWPGWGPSGCAWPCCAGSSPRPAPGCPRPAASRRTGWTRCWTPRR